MSDYNIHIHLPDADKEPAKSDKPVQEAPQNKMGQWFDNLLGKIRQCYDWKSFYALEEEFSKAGLALRDTEGGRKVLCRLEGGKPVIDQIIDDYIFAGSTNTLDEEIAQRALEIIVHFVESKASTPQVVADSSQEYSRELALYGHPLKIYSESSAASQQEVTFLSRLMELQGENTP
jgi:hypothetical protein